MNLRIKNERIAGMRLDATVKCIEVAENRSFQKNRLIFGLRSTVMIVMIVHILTVAAQLSMHPQAGLRILTASSEALSKYLMSSL